MGSSVERHRAPSVPGQRAPTHNQELLASLSRSLIQWRMSSRPGGDTREAESRESGLRAPESTEHTRTVSIVWISSKNSGLSGCGFVVSPRWIMSCAHVVHPDWLRNRRRWPETTLPDDLMVTGAGANVCVKRVVPSPACEGEEPDWVAIEVSSCIELEPLALMQGLRVELLEQFRQSYEGAFRTREGRIVRAPRLKIVGTWTEQEVLIRGQVESGMPVGASGSPLLVRNGNRVAAAGMFYLGGEGVGQSDFYGSDALIRLLRATGIEPRVVAASELLGAAQPNGAENSLTELHPSLAPAARDLAGDRSSSARVGVLRLVASRRSGLLSLAAVTMAAVAGGASWLLRPPASALEPSQQARLQHVCRTLSHALGQQQDAGGGFSALAYRNVLEPNDYSTGQVLACLYTSVQCRYGVFEEERRVRGFDALARFADARLSQKSGEVKAFSWMAIAAARYLRISNNPAARRLLLALRDVVAQYQLADGSFEVLKDGPDSGRPNAYATVLAGWALIESLRAGENSAAVMLAAHRVTSWLAENFDAVSTDPFVAIRPVNGLAQHAFWVLEFHRATLGRARTKAEERVAEHVAADIVARCVGKEEDASPCEPGNGRIRVDRSRRSEVYTMLWLPWATLSALHLSADPPLALGSSTEAIRTATATLVQHIITRANLGFTVRFEPAEQLFAISEAILGFAHGPSGAKRELQTCPAVQADSRLR